MGKTNFSFTLIWCKYSFSAQDHSFCHQSRQTFLNQKNGVKKCYFIYNCSLRSLSTNIQAMHYFFLLNPACSSLDIFLPIPSMDLQPLNVCSKLQYLENLLFCWHNLHPVSTNKKNNTVQCWKLTLVFLPIQVWKASGEYKSLITHPFGQYKFHFWVKLKIFITLLFIFHFGKNISQQKLTGLINGCQF